MSLIDNISEYYNMKVETATIKKRRLIMAFMACIIWVGAFCLWLILPIGFDYVVFTCCILLIMMLAILDGVYECILEMRRIQTINFISRADHTKLIIQECNRGKR